MKNQPLLHKFSWLLATCLASALVFSACNRSGQEHPTRQGQPGKEHPQKESPAKEQTNQPPPAPTP